MILLRRLFPWIVLAFSLNAQAQNANMAYVFPAGTPKDVPVPSGLMGEWQPATPDSIVLTGDAGQTYAQGYLRRYGDIGTKHVYACTAVVPAGQRDGCPALGVYTDERFIPHWQVYRVPTPPVCYGNTTRCSPLSFQTATGNGELAMCVGQYENRGTASAPRWVTRCGCANKLEISQADWSAWKEASNPSTTKTRRDALYRLFMTRGLSPLERQTCAAIFADNPPPR